MSKFKVGVGADELPVHYYRGGVGKSEERRGEEG